MSLLQSNVAKIGKRLEGARYTSQALGKGEVQVDACPSKWGFITYYGLQLLANVQDQKTFAEGSELWLTERKYFKQGISTGCLEFFISYQSLYTLSLRFNTVALLILKGNTRNNSEQHSRWLISPGQAQ